MESNDFHPDEAGVRIFTAGPGSVLRFSGDLYVSVQRHGQVILWHYAFARHWFKVNLTTDLTGRIVEPGDDDHGGRFAVNCDIATPMRRHGQAVYAVDLFADVLVRADGVSYRVTDLEEFDRAGRDGLILPGEWRGALRGLAELTGIIDRGDFLAWLSLACPVDPPAASPPASAPLAQVRLLGRDSRASWLRST